MKVYRIALWVLTGCYAVLWCGGAVSYLFLDGPPSGARWTAPAFLFLAAALMLLVAPSGGRLSLLGAAILGTAAEFAGLRWGYPFGSYTYTEVLEPSVFGVPVAIGCAWLILFAYVRRMLAQLGLSPWRRAVAGAFGLTAIDLLIDPLASGPLGYWTWSGEGRYYGVPAANFAGWFLVALILFLAFRELPAQEQKTAYVGLSVLLFFALIAVRYGMIGPVIVGTVLMVLHFLLLYLYRGPGGKP